MKNQFTNEIISTIMTLLSENYKQPIFLDPDELIFLRRELTEEGAIYYPIVNDSEEKKVSPILHLNETKLFSIFDIKKATKSVEKRLNSGLQAVEMRINHRTESENNRTESDSQPELNRNTNRTKSDAKATKKRIELLRYHGLEPFHDKYTDERFNMIAELEELTYRLILDGSENVKQWAKDNFKEAEKTAVKDIGGLASLLDRTQKKRNQQMAALKTNVKLEQKKRFSDKLKIVVTVIIIGFGLVIGLVLGFSKKEKNTQSDQTETEITLNSTTKIYTPSEVDILINDYEKKHGVKIWDFRRKEIKKDFSGVKLTEPEANDIINNHVEIMKKSSSTSKTTTPKKTTTPQQTTPKKTETVQIPTKQKEQNESGIYYNPNLRTVTKAN